MRKKWIMGFIVAAIAAIVGVGAVLAASPTSAPSAPALQDDGGDSATSTRPFQELRLGHRLAGLIPRLVQGDLQVLGEDGQVITVTVTPAKDMIPS